MWRGAFFSARRRLGWQDGPKVQSAISGSDLPRDESRGSAEGGFQGRRGPAEAPGDAGEACGKTEREVHAYCLMGTHFHLLLETPQPNLVLAEIGIPKDSEAGLTCQVWRRSLAGSRFNETDIYRRSSWGADLGQFPGRSRRWHPRHSPSATISPGQHLPGRGDGYCS